MANNPDILPPSDKKFDLLQEILVAAVIAKATDWNIPAGEIAKVTAKQGPWISTWAIAKNKQNSTTAQKQARDDARKNYEKVLRPFIQKWIYLNEQMDAAAVEKCGLKPRDPNRTAANKPEQAVVQVKRGEEGELITKCRAVAGAKHYGCILTEGAPLPAWVMISPDGNLEIDIARAAAIPNLKSVSANLTDQRVKRLTRLHAGSTYYIYYYAVNAAGVGALSEPVSIVVW